jgi:hypothetical protein
LSAAPLVRARIASRSLLCLKAYSSEPGNVESGSRSTKSRASSSLSVAFTRSISFWFWGM